MRPIPDVAKRIIRDKEKLRLYVFDDAHWPSREAKPGDHIDGTLTAGWGHTHGLTIGMKVTEQMAEDWLEEDLQTAALALIKKCGADVIEELTENQYGCMIDFVYTLGTGDPHKPEWTIWKRMRAKAFDQVPLEIAKFVNRTIKNPDGTTSVVKSNGLVDRRNAEIGLWAIAEPGTDDEHVPASVTRCNPTPPTPSDPVPVKKSRGLIAGAAALVAAVPQGVDSLSHAVSPYAHHSATLEQWIAGLFMVAGVCAGVSWAYMYWQKRNSQN